MAKPRVVTPIAIVLQAVTNAIKEQFDGKIYPVYDPTLEYVEVAKGLRAQRSAQQVAEDAHFPMLGFNRTHLQYNSVFQERSVARPLSERSEGVMLNYWSLMGQFEFNFRYIDNDLARLESYEVLYATKAIMRNLKKLIVKIPVIGEVEYTLDWDPMDGNDFVKTPAQYFALTGKCLIRGPFFAFEEAPNTIIKWLNLSVRNWSAEVIYYDNTVPLDSDGSPLPPIITFPTFDVNQIISKDPQNAIVKGADGGLLVANETTTDTDYLAHYLLARG